MQIRRRGSDKAESPSHSKSSWWDSLFGQQRPSSSPRHPDKVRMSCVPNSRASSPAQSDTTWVSRPQSASNNRLPRPRDKSAVLSTSTSTGSQDSPVRARRPLTPINTSSAFASPGTSPMPEGQFPGDARGPSAEALTSLANLTEFLQVCFSLFASILVLIPRCCILPHLHQGSFQMFNWPKLSNMYTWHQMRTAERMLWDHSADTLTSQSANIADCLQAFVYSVHLTICTLDLVAVMCLCSSTRNLSECHWI